ncbi:lipopolysaccharide biosynthesis protein [Streptomyces sp. NPDC047928]|uniref:lipopolysaccharide biosynthesis protein n=1 Tax=unclassified Streptomyces TaxID=2593676 RepID=UPI003711B60D
MHRAPGTEPGRAATGSGAEGSGGSGAEGSGGSGASSGSGGSGSSGDSMFRNAYALMLSTGVSAALGLGFWLVAARYYTEEAVGQGSAAIAAMKLLASITATTMIGAVVRYVPRAGRATGPLVWRAYGVSSLVVCLASAAFLVTLDLWGPSFAPLHGLAAGAFFTAACVAWALLTLQDGVLTGLRKAVWVPVGNAVFSVGKLLLLVVFATALPALGVFVSWAAAIALSVLPLGWLIFRRLIPRQAAADHDREPPTMGEMRRFLAGDSVGALFSLAMINLLPVMVAVRFDAAHNGFFYTAYTVGGTMEFMAINMASSLTAHASHSPGSLADGVRGALRRMALLLVPVVLVLVVFAPQILAPFGASYAEHGTTVLRLLAAAALPRVAVELYIGVLRVQGRTGMLAAVQGAMCVLVLGSAAALMAPAGIAGAGLAMLLSMTVMAAAAAPGLRAALLGRPPKPPRPRRRRRNAADPGYGTRWAARRAEAAAAPPAPAGYLPGGQDTATPAFGFPVYVQDRNPDREPHPVRAPGREPGREAGPEPGPEAEPRPDAEPDPGPEAEPGPEAAPRPEAGPDPGPRPLREADADRRVVAALWALLAVAAALFWGPLAQVRDLGVERLSGAGLVRALPPPTVGAGVLLVVVYCALLALRRLRPVLTGTALLVTFAALHSAPPLLGIRPDPLSGPGAGVLAGALTDAGLAGPGPDDPVLRALPVAVQVLCLALVAVALRALDVEARGVAGAVWVLAVAGWAAQDAFAAAALPVLVVLGVAAAAARVAARYRPRRA